MTLKLAEGTHPEAEGVRCRGGHWPPGFVIASQSYADAQCAPLHGIVIPTGPGKPSSGVMECCRLKFPDGIKTGREPQHSPVPG